MALQPQSPLQDQIRNQTQSKNILYFLFFAAFAYMLYLVSTTQPNIFYSGDAGLKFMVIKQLSVGEGFRYISHTQPAWVEEIWKQGYFPIRKPFVFTGPEGYLFVFAPPFQIMSSFLYVKFGYLGLYIVPFISILVLWVWFINMLLKLGFSTQRTALMFFILAFCSHLTLYGAVYWEHSLGTLLLFSGLYFIMCPPSQLWKVFVLGCLSGLAIWFRPESLLLNLLYMGALLLINFRKITLAHWVFGFGVAVGTASFLVFNKIQYGVFFGIHGSQVLTDTEYWSKLRVVASNIYHINSYLLKHFSLVLLFMPILVAWIFYKWPLYRKSIALMLVVIAFCLSGPFIFPNDGGKQWGPRFYLPLLPLILLVLAYTQDQWESRLARLRTPLLVFAVAAIGYNFVLNTIIGAKQLRYDNIERILPAYDYVKKDPGSTVVINSEFITMELSALYREKNIFLASDTTSFNKLLPMLKAQGIDHFVYINDAELPVGMGDILNSKGVNLVQKGTYRVGVFPLN